LSADEQIGKGRRGAMVVHKIKILPEYFKAVAEGRKTFEIRFDDRHYREGDTLVLKEWTEGKYTGYEITKQVGYVTDYEQKPGFVVFSLV
jgi:ASC-1-like (ASCH) protein